MKIPQLSKDERIIQFTKAVMDFDSDKIDIYQLFERLKIKKLDDWVYLILYINDEHPERFRYVDHSTLTKEIKEVEKKESKYSIKVYRVCSHNLYYDYIQKPKEGIVV